MMIPKTKQPLVSVILSYYNDSRFLADSVRSILAQTYDNFECILINHASTDESRRIAHSFTDARIKHVDLPFNYGASGNILVLAGLAVARGEYIKLFCADDILLPEGLEVLVQQALFSSADLVFGDISFVDVSKKLLNINYFKTRFPAGESPIFYLRQLLCGTSCFPYPGNLIKRSVLDKIDFDVVSVGVADMNLWAGILLAGGKLSFVQETVALYRVHENQMCGISQKESIRKRLCFEDVVFIQQFFDRPPSWKMVRDLLPNDNFAQLLGPEDNDLTSFVLAHYVSNSGMTAGQVLAARVFLSRALRSETMRRRLEERFSWSIKNLRDDILARPVYVQYSGKDFAKDLPLSVLCYCFFRKLMFILTLRDWRHRRQEKKNRVL